MLKPQWDLLLKKMMDAAVGITVLGIYDSLTSNTGNAIKMVLFGFIWLIVPWCLISIKEKED